MRLLMGDACGVDGVDIAVAGDDRDELGAIAREEVYDAGGDIAGGEDFGEDDGEEGGGAAAALGIRASASEPRRWCCRRADAAGR